MIRCDFVSNSSSSSFIISLDTDKCPFSDFVKIVCERTVNKKSEYAIPNLYEHNKIVLEYCVEHYNPLFVGSINENIKDVILTKNNIHEKFGIDLDKLIQKLKKEGKPSEETYKNYPQLYNYIDYGGDLFKIDEDYNTILNKRFISNSGFVFPKHEIGRINYLYKTCNSIKNLIDYDKKCNISVKSFLTYGITRDTIEISKFILENSEDFKYYTDYGKIELYENLMNENNKIFSIQINKDDSGMDDFSIYSQCEDMTLDIDGVKILDCEYM